MAFLTLGIFLCHKNLKQMPQLWLGIFQMTLRSEIPICGIFFTEDGAFFSSGGLTTLVGCGRGVRCFRKRGEESVWGKEEEEEVAEFDIITSEERRGKGEGGAIKKPGGDFCLLFSPAAANTLFFSFSPPPIGGGGLHFPRDWWKKVSYKFNIFFLFHYCFSSKFCCSFPRCVL